MADSMVVRTDFLGRDKSITDTFERMGRSADRFSNQASSAFSRVQNSSDRASSAMRNSTKQGYKFGTIVKGILAANALRGGIGLIGSGFRKLGEDFLSFDDTIIGAAARFDDIGPGAADLTGKITMLGKATRDSIKGSRFAATDAAAAVNELAKAGYASDSALGIMPRMLEFATANQEKLAEATTMSSDILGGFGLRSKDVQQQLRNHIRLNDMLTKSSLLSTGGLRDLFETLQQTAPLTEKTSIKPMAPEELLAAAVVLSNAGLKGTEAATAIKRSLLNIFAPASPMAEEFKTNGVKIYDTVTGRALKYSVVLGQLSGKLSKLTEEQRAPILRRIFGVYGLAGSLKLMQGLKDMAEFEQKIANSSGTTKQVADVQNMSTYAKVINLANTALEKGFQILERFNGPGQKGIEGLTNKIRNFKVQPLVEGLTAIGKTVGLLYTMVAPFLPALPYIVAGFVAWNAALKIATMMKWGFMIGAFLTDTIAILGPLNMMTVLVKTLTVAMSALAAPFATVAAAFSVITAGYSLVTGKDNFISRLAQDMGLVPKLSTNAEGFNTGFASGKWADDAPNKKEAEARRIQFQGQLNIAGAPAGSTVESRTTGAPSFDLNLLGAQ